MNISEITQEILREIAPTVYLEIEELKFRLDQLSDTEPGPFYDSVKFKYGDPTIVFITTETNDTIRNEAHRILNKDSNQGGRNIAANNWDWASRRINEVRDIVSEFNCGHGIEVYSEDYPILVGYHEFK